MIGAQILWGCIIWIVPLVYVLLRNEAKWKKNIVVGTTLPYEARQDPEVEEVLRRYRRQLGWVSILLLLVVVPCLFIPRFSVQFIVWSFWILLAMILPQIPFVLTNKALRRIKEERGWRQRPSAQVVSDLTAAAIPMKWLSPWWFLPPLVLSLVPLVLDRELWVLWLVDAILVVFCYVGYRWLFRLRAEVVDENTDLTVALTRLRRYNWGKTWLWIAWATGFFNLGMCLTLEWFWAAMAVTLVYSVVVVVATIGIEFRVRGAQERLTADSGKDFYVDEDDQWIWGMFYYNPNDKRLVVNNRTGVNTTFNMAKRGAQIFMGLTALIMLALPLVGVWLMHEEAIPVELTVTETAVVARHSGTEYEVPFEDIDSVELLTERPDSSRVAGTAMESVSKGRYKNDEWGRFTCCIDPRTGPWLLLRTTDGEIWLFGASDSAATEAVYAAVEAAAT